MRVDVEEELCCDDGRGEDGRCEGDEDGVEGFAGRLGGTYVVD